MKKLIFSAGILFALAIGVQAQSSEKDPNVISSGDKVSKRIFQTENPASDRNESWEVRAVSGVSFAASNTADGSTNSYKHFLRITMTLQMADPKAGNCQLVFYSPNDPSPYAAGRPEGILSIYYPISVYSDIKEKLEQSLQARRKVTVKITEKTNGFREGVLIF